ncbi:MAG: DUF2911 domain-containing protein [Saprospiraceae bacterium]
MKSILFMLATLFLGLTVSAQYKIGILPRTSPDKGIYEQIGYTGVEITYGAPKTNGRTIWGDIVPYDEVWRAGANDATRIEFSEDVEIDSNILPKGIYSLFIIPHESDAWTVIFNAEYDQWGAYNYNKYQDILRVEVKPKEIPLQEKLTYTIDGLSYEKCVISMKWSDVQIDVVINTKYLEILQREIEISASNSDQEIASVVYLQGAEYLLRRNQYLDVASNWVDKSQELFDPKSEWNSQYYPREYILGHMHWTKAKVLAANNNYKMALAYANKMKNINGGEINYYSEENEFEKIDIQMAHWESKQ